MRSQGTIVYQDLNKKIIVTNDTKSFGDNLMRSELLFDGLGRTVETRSYETSANYIAVHTQFDALGRPYKSSHPFRPYLNESAQWTTTQFDSLGRVKEIKTPDDAVLTRTYSGPSTTVTDQAGHSKAGTADALGRLLKVTEDDNGTYYETFYTYDVLGRLRKTAQSSGTTTQNRYFMHDDLGRLIRAKQVEQSANPGLNLTDTVTSNNSWSVAYTYDNNGNIVTKRDALDRIIDATYDDLNRITFRDYSDITPDVSFAYENQSIPNSRGPTNRR